MVEFNVYSAACAPAEIFRLRYEIYVEELSRPQAYACHDSRTIFDPLDENAYHCVASRDGEIIGCLRLNLLREGSVQPYFDFYELHRLSFDQQRFASICTRNMVRRQFRKTTVAVKMMNAIYEYALGHGVRTNFMDVNEPLVGLFNRLGYDRLFEKMHPDYGLVTVMKLDLLDHPRLERTRSTFAPICRRHLKQSHEVAPA